MGENLYKFKMTVEYEKFYSEGSCYGAYTFTTCEELPHLKPYLFEDEIEEKPRFLGNIAGKMQQLYIGSEYEVEATMEFNKRYNCYQYTPKSIRTLKPSTAKNQEKFLRTVTTEKQAKILLDAYPNIVEDVINGVEIDLSKTKGIKEKLFEKIKEKVIRNYVISDILILLQPLGVTFKVVEKLLKYESNPEILKKKLLDNPYMLTKIRGLGFKKIDGLALKLNPILRESLIRTKAFLTSYFYGLGNQNGDTWTTIDILNNQIKGNIHECYSIYEKLIEEERGKTNDDDKFLKLDKNQVGLYRFYDTEKSTYEILKDINKYVVPVMDVNLEESLARTEKRLGFSLTDEQVNAIKSTIDNGVTIIKGKAGVGKSVSINGLVDLYKGKQTMAFCSLSAKASQRIKEATGEEATTIHKLLGYNGSEFEKNAECPINADVVILDEASMVNAETFLALVRAIKIGARLIIIFDDAQLPPIGYGNIAVDLLSRDEFKICELTIVHRQAQKSGILTDANKIRECINPLDKASLKEVHGELQDMYYMFRNDGEAIRSIAVNTYLKAVKEVGVDEVCIIVPRKSGCTNSTNEINMIIQNHLISKKVAELKRGDVTFKEGCKVIQKVNDNDKGVYNGEIGYMTSIYKDNETKKDMFKVEFDNNKVIQYNREDLGNIELGYALTIHSSQGSQWHTVVTVLDDSHYILLSNNLLYTAITRSSKRCLLVSEPKAFQVCIKKKDKRNTYLKNF